MAMSDHVIMVIVCFGTSIIINGARQEGNRTFSRVFDINVKFIKIKRFHTSFYKKGACNLIGNSISLQLNCM